MTHAQMMPAASWNMTPKMRSLWFCGTMSPYPILVTVMAAKCRDAVYNPDDGKHSDRRAPFVCLWTPVMQRGDIL